jgi:hypothetical protein
MPARVHVGSTAQVLDPVLVQDQETVANGHVREWVALSGIDATGQGDVLFNVHAHIVQQIYRQRNKSLPEVKFAKKEGNKMTNVCFYFLKKSSRAHFM